jgi:Ca2+-binding RTX toxin-like protein
VVLGETSKEKRVWGPALAGYFVGTRDHDDLVGTNQDDEMYGLAGRDDIRGKDGEDYIEGGTGNDDLFGQDDRDEIYGGAGLDRIVGGRGNDYINSADNGRVDTVDCGGGLNDRAVVDDEDIVVGGTTGTGSCEVVRVVP